MTRASPPAIRSLVAIRRAIGHVAAILLLLSATAPTPAAAAKPPKWADPCAAPSKELQKAKGSVQRLILTRAAIGGALGLGVALLTGKGAANAVKGLIAGAAGGAAAGYIESKLRQNSDRRALAGSVNQDIAATNAEAARALRAFSQVRTCRVAAAAQIKASADRGEIDRATATARLASQREALEKDIAAVEAFTQDFDSATERFRGAAGYLAEGVPENQAYIARYAMPAAPPPPPLLLARSSANVRASPDAKAPVVGKLGKGEIAVPVVADMPVQPADPARKTVAVNREADWREVRLPSGQRGYVATALVREKPAPPPPPIDMARVSPEVRAVSQPLYEGVEKRSALQAEVRTARADSAGATFTI